MTLDDHFAQAVALHQQGKLAEAAPHYEAMLAIDPDNFAALHNLGILRTRQGEIDAAIGLIGRAIAREPGSADAQNSLGNALVAASRFTEAVTAFGQAVALNPAHAQAHGNLGNALQAIERHEEAIGCYDRALELAPDYVEALENLGRALAALEHHAEAAVAYERALALKPGRASAYNNYATSLNALGRYAEAIANYENALALKPDFAEAYNNIGNTMSSLNRHAEALANYEKALALKPDFAEAHNNTGNAMLSLKRREEALGAYERAVAFKPDFAQAHSNRGIVLSALDRFAEATASLERALALKPDFPEAHCDLANALVAQNRYDEAVRNLRQALALRPDMAIAYNNLAGVLWETRRHDEALEHFQTALALQPDYVDANFNLGFVLLQLGRFETGWLQSEWRRMRAAKEEPPRRFSRPLWMGDGDLAGKTLLLHAEQGFGDTIQFARYVPLLARRGAKIVLEVQKPLVPLLGSLEGVVSIHAQGDELPDFDRHCPLMSLACALKTTFASLPAEVPYIAPDPTRLAKWQGLIEGIARPRIGLAWSGNPKHKNDRNRSIALEQLRPLLQTSGRQFVVLQRDLRERDVAALGDIPGLTVLGERLEDFADTAAVASMLDLVISVDTSIAHLAGALGKPLWIMLPFVSDWRWLLDRDDSPWYPTARLFRQPKLDDWQSVIASVCATAAASYRAAG